MGLTKQSESKAVYLAIKDYSIWRELKQRVDGCEEITVTNPKTKEVLTKYGYHYRDLEGYVVKLEKYDTAAKFTTRYFGFKLHLIEGADTFVLDLPYTSQVLRRLLRIAPNVDWSRPLQLTVFRGKKGKKGDDETGIWFRQGGATVKSFYTRETPNGMPAAVQDPHTQEWDFRAQHRWLVDQLINKTAPEILAIAKDAARPAPAPVTSDAAEPDRAEDVDTAQVDAGEWGITDDDVPFRWPRPARRGANENENLFQMQTRTTA
jgi:hypothetical protein